MFKAILLSLLCLGLTACTSSFTDVHKTAVIYKPKTKPKAKIDKSKQKGEITKYVCKGNKVLKITQNKSSKKQKNHSISLTFGNTTHRLTKVVSESGEKYGNLSWQWQKRREYGTLSNSVGKPLAEKCVRQF